MDCKAVIKIKQGSQAILLGHKEEGFPASLGVALSLSLPYQWEAWQGEKIANKLVKEGCRKVGPNYGGHKVDVLMQQSLTESYGYVVDCDERRVVCYHLGFGKRLEDATKSDEMPIPRI